MDKNVYIYNMSDESGPIGCGLVLADSEGAAREKLLVRTLGIWTMIVFPLKKSRKIASMNPAYTFWYKANGGRLCAKQY